MQAYDRYIQQHQEEFIEELKTFCAQPSISATGEGIEEMAAMVRQKMEELGASVQMLNVGPDEPQVVYASLGSGRDDTSMVLLTLGTGVGAGIIVHGQLINGVNSFGSECGHIVVD